MPNIQMASAKYHFSHTCNERLMFQSESQRLWRKTPLCMAANDTPFASEEIHLPTTLSIPLERKQLLKA